MTKNMVAALEKLYRSTENAGWIAYRTAEALERRGLVLSPRRQKTGGRAFPTYFVRLSAEGKAFCLRHYQQIGKHDRS